MKPDTQIKELWEQFRDALTIAYTVENKLHGNGSAHNVAGALRDYARDQMHHDDLRELLDEELQNERQQHSICTRAYPVYCISNLSRAKLLIMQNAVDGCTLDKMPPATIFMTYRHSAAEAMLLGFMAKGSLKHEWRNAVQAIDYTKLHS